jgi:hypothetical protein
MRHLISYTINEDLSNEHGGGNCFDCSYDYIMNNGFKRPDLRLVHGFVSGQGALSGYRFAHGWCEEGEEVYDNSNGKMRTIPKILYYGIGNINPEECKYYDYDQAMDISVEHGHKGPWEIENTHYHESWNRKARKK